MFRRIASLAALLFACSSVDDEGLVVKFAPTALLPVTDAPTTAEKTLNITAKKQTAKDGPNPADFTVAMDDEAKGFGDLAEGPGNPFVTRVIDGSTPPAPGPNMKKVLRFTTLADLQLSDDESPTRLGIYDADGLTSAALRPQDTDMCRLANAAVRTINALHRKEPVAFTLLGGDNADSAQMNELEWTLGILSGASSVECDSGDDDDPIPGADNDGKDPFVAEGLAMPWKWTTGNHDVLVQGNIMVQDANEQIVLGNTASGGTRNYLHGGAVETGDFVIPDPKRKLNHRADVMAMVAADKDGHGIGASEKASGRATYTFDAEGSNIRFLVMDTAHEAGGADGVIKQSEIDRVIKPALDKAKADGKWVILASHHAVGSLTLDGGTFGSTESDALTGEAWSAFVGQYPNVLFSMVAHSHENSVKMITPAGAGGHAWWEVMTAAIADFPHQFRIVEIFDMDNGWVMMRSSPVDISVANDPVAAAGRKRGVVDAVTGYASDGTGTADDRNVELWIKKP